MTVEERLEALEKEVQRLKDVQAIKELKSKYFRALDTKNWDELETTMTPNISTAYSNGKLVFHGPKEITNYFKESMPDTEITLHQGHNPVIWFESDTVAYGKWYNNPISTMSALGIITGYPDGTFKPDQNITRAEAMTMINRVLCRMPQSESDLLDSMVTWPDNKPSDWHYLAVQEATNSHDFNRQGEVGESWTKLTSVPDWTRYQ